MKVAINGAGIAGPTLAFWLGKAGHEVLLVEESAGLRTGGYIIDFWGIGYDIVDKMGLIPQVCERGYQIKEVRFVDDEGRQHGGFAVDVFGRMTNGRFTSVRRSDISAIIYDVLGENVRTLFNDSIVELTENGDRVRARFKHAEADDFDLVIGADGLHSKIREIVFGPEKDFELSLGYHVAAFEIDGYRPRDELVYVSHDKPGRQVSRFSMRDDKTLVLFVFRDEHLHSTPCTLSEQKAALRDTFGGLGWECSPILDAMDSAASIYFDTVSQIRMEHWTRGRVGLVGDAAACVSLMAGEGTGLAIAEAYVLAGELNRSNGDFAHAFSAYERLMMPFLKQKQKSAAKFASAFAPKTSLGIVFRNLITRLLRIPAIADYVIGRDLRDNILLPDYTSNEVTGRG